MRALQNIVVTASVADSCTNKTYLPKLGSHLIPARKKYISGSATSTRFNWRADKQSVPAGNLNFELDDAPLHADAIIGADSPALANLHVKKIKKVDNSWSNGWDQA